MLLILFVFSLLTGPAEYLTHEGAHYMIARAFGAHPIMHFDRIELLPSTHLTPAQNLLFAAAGPAADWAVGIVAWCSSPAALRRWRSSLRSG